MNWKQAILRLKAMILKDKQYMNGYRLVIRKVKGKRKSGYSSTIAGYKKSILRKQEAIEYINSRNEVKYNWKELCKKFKFRSRYL